MHQVRTTWLSTDIIIGQELLLIFLWFQLTSRNEMSSVHSMWIHISIQVPFFFLKGSVNAINFSFSCYSLRLPSNTLIPTESYKLEWKLDCTRELTRFMFRPSVLKNMLLVSFLSYWTLGRIRMNLMSRPFSSDYPFNTRV